MITTILVPLDGSPLAALAVPQARRLAERAGATIVLVRVVPGAVVTPTDQGMALAGAERYLRAVADELAGQGCAVRHDVFVDEPAEGILLAALSHKADVIVMGTHGLTGLRHALLGSVAEEVLRGTDLPVLLVQPERGARELPPAGGPLLKVLVPLDGTPSGERALRFIAQEQFARAAEILLVHGEPPVPLPGTARGYPFAVGAGVYIPQDMVDEADRETTAQCRADREYLERVAHRYLEGRAWSTFVPLEDPAQAILQLAAEQRVDLIAMTTHARTGLARLTEGSVAAHVLRHAGMPVLLMRQSAGLGIETAPRSAASAGTPA
jgi:nucleotide-binding universal stress UspA family protein